MSHLLVRQVPDELRVRALDDLAELKGEQMPYLVERKAPGAVDWVVVSRHALEDEAADALAEAARFEIIFGERRWRAAGALNMERVPCVVANLSDGEVLEKMLVENMQREDFSPMEEAVGFARLLELRDGDGKAMYSPKKIAERIGCSVAHIQQRLDLRKLEGTEAGKALEAGKLPVSVARVIARMPTRELREEVAAKALHDPVTGGGVMSLPRLEQMVAEEYMRQLRGAPFDREDAGLVPVETDAAGERLAGGACGDCPFLERAKSQHHLCTNPTCFEKKVRAAHESWRVSVTDEASRRVGLSMEEAAELWDFTDIQLHPQAPYVDLDHLPENRFLVPGTIDAPKWRELLAKSEVRVYLAKDKKHKVHELVLTDVALEAGRLARPELFRSAERQKRAVEQKVEQAKESAAEFAKAQSKMLTGAVRAGEIDQAKLAAVCVEGLRGLKNPENGPLWRMVSETALLALDEIGALEDMARRHGGIPSEIAAEGVLDWMKAHCWKMEAPLRLGMLCELVLSLLPWTNDRVAAVARHLQIDLKAVEKREKERFAALDARAKQDEKIAAGMVWDGQKEKVEDFVWNSHNVCENPDRLNLAMPKGSKVKVEIKLGRSVRGWHYGYDFRDNTGGAGGGAHCGHAGYSSRALAVATAIKAAVEHFKHLEDVVDWLRSYLGYIQIGLPKAEPKKATPKTKSKAKAPAKKKGGAK